jgi:hypothetical protein
LDLTAAGCLLLVTGFWVLAAGFWLLASGFWLLASGFGYGSGQPSGTGKGRSGLPSSRILSNSIETASLTVEACMAD